MADIEITCRKCNTITAVSEFAAPEAIVCRSCGAKLDKPAQAPFSPSRPRLRLRDKQQPEAPADGEDARPAHAAAAQDAPKPGYLASLRPPAPTKRRRTDARGGHIIAAWATFLLLGAAMYFVRYRGVLPPELSDKLKTFAPIIVVAFYVLTLLKAYQDSVFQGILCTLIPPYALFYLLVFNDDFYARAVFAGLLVGIGQDSYLFFHRHVLAIAKAIHEWIASGG